MIDEIREWFGVSWELDKGCYGGVRFVRGAESIYSPHGVIGASWCCGEVTHYAHTIPELAARVRAWHLEQARGIRVAESSD